jgi:hypothetical protein
MTKEELQAIRELVNKVTDGPWEAHDTTVFAEGIDIGQFDFPEDAEFAAWCREGVPKLLDEVERLRDALTRIASLDPTSSSAYMVGRPDMTAAGYAVSTARQALDGE